MTIAEIIEKYPNLPRKFLVKFALCCANDVKHLLRDKRSFKALQATELWLEDKISGKEMYADARNSYNAYAEMFTIAGTTLDKRVAACLVIYNAARGTDINVNIVDIGMSISYWVSQALEISEYKYRDKLLEMIDQLNDMEKLLYLR